MSSMFSMQPTELCLINYFGGGNKNIYVHYKNIPEPFCVDCQIYFIYSL